MTQEKKSGFAFHVHHDVLVEYCFDFNERVKAIKRDKPPEEQETRLRLFKIIPDNRVPQPLQKAGQAYDEVTRVYNEAWRAYDEVYQTYKSELIKLHEELCPDCPWDGKTIFPE